MKSRSLAGIAFVAAIMLAAGFGCSDDNGTTPDAGKPDVGKPDSAVPTEGGTEGGTDAAATVDFVGVVEGFGENGALKSGVTVEIYDNDTGKGTGTTAVTDAAGKVTLPGLTKGKLYGFKMSLANYKDTFVWNIVAGDYTEETLWAVSNTVYQIALGMAGLTPEAGKGTVAGAVYWVDAQAKEEGIGCAKVSTTPVTPDIRYMDKTTGMPTTLANQACTANKETEGNGRFVAANLPVGQVTLSAKDSQDGDIGSTTLWSIADAIAVSNIYATAAVTSNPTPATCNCTP